MLADSTSVCSCVTGLRDVLLQLTSLVGEEGMELLELYQDETRGSLACVAVPQPAVVRQQVDGAVPQPAVVNQKADGAVPQPAMVKQQAEMNYQRRAEAIIADDNCYKFTFVCTSSHLSVIVVEFTPPVPPHVWYVSCCLRM